MPDHRPRTTPVLLAALVLVLGANVAAYAANGRPLLLGQDNSETRPATVKNTGTGPALDLVTKPGAPPLAVSSKKVVKRLNADAVDGLDAADLATVVHRYVLPHTEPTNSIALSFRGLPAGQWLATYSVVTQGSTSRPICFFRTGSSSPAQALTWGVESGGGYHSLAATAVVDTSSDTVKLYCAGTAHTIYSKSFDTQSTVAFTPLNGVRDGSAEPTNLRSAPRTAPGTR